MMANERINLNAREAESLPQTLAAFHSATGMGIRVSHAEAATPLWTCENPFCHLMRVCGNRATPCRAKRVFNSNTSGVPVMTWRCSAGLEHVAVAVPGAAGVAGWIESGQVFLAPPQREDFIGFCQRHPDWREPGALVEAEAAFFATPVLTRERLEAGTKLLRLVAREIEPLVRHHSASSSVPSHDPVEKAKQYVARNLGEMIRLSELAEHVTLCPAHLCRVFKRRTGQTLGDFIADARVERAKRLLAQTGSRAVDAAYAAGFQSVRQFNHVFKARTRLTPSQYRRSLQSSSEF